MAVRMKPDGRWTCYYRGPDGKQKDEYFGRGEAGEDAAWRRNEELGLSKRKIKELADKPTFGHLARVYTQSKNFSANSLKHLKIRLEKNILPFFGNRVATALTDQDLDNYVRRRRKDGVKYATITRELTDVKAILNFAVKRKPSLIAANPVRDYQKPGEGDAAVIDPPTIKETEKILAAASPHLFRAIKLSWFLGLRPGAVELLSLSWPAVNWETSTIRILSAQKGGADRRRRQNVRHVPIHEDLVGELKGWHREDRAAKWAGRCRENGWPVVHYFGRRIKKLQTTWKNTLLRAGIDPKHRRIRPYDLRHFFVTRALEEGADIKALAQVVGSRPETLMRHYQHVTQAVHRQTVATIPALKTAKPYQQKKRKPAVEAGKKKGEKGVKN
jgi:integrase